MCKCRVRKVKEIPIHFSLREHGQSKLTVAQQFKYLEHLSRLYDFYYPRAAPIIKFLIATGCGWLVALTPFALMVKRGVNPFAAPTLAYLVTIFTTALFHFRYVRTQREFLVARHPWLDFIFISLAEWATCAVSALWLVNRAPVRAIELFLIPFGLATVVRYILRKELMQDIRGLRRDIRKEEWV